MRLKYLFFILILSCASLACNSSKKLASSLDSSELQANIEQFIHCHNTQNFNCLLDLYDKDYRSLSPNIQPESPSHFIKKILNNLDKYNFEVVIEIKEINCSESLGYVTMNWQLKTKGIPKEDDPYSNVQRLDIWKMGDDMQWRIFRTVIYDKRTF